MHYLRNDASELDQIFFCLYFLLPQLGLSGGLVMNACMYVILRMSYFLTMDPMVA